MQEYEVPKKIYCLANRNARDMCVMQMDLKISLTGPGVYVTVGPQKRELSSFFLLVLSCDHDREEGFGNLITSNAEKVLPLPHEFPWQSATMPKSPPSL